MTGMWKPQLKPIIESWYRMSLNLNSEWNTCRALETDKIISNMFAISNKDC